MEAVSILMHVKPQLIKDPNGGFKKIKDYWGPASKKLLGDTKFLKKLLKYDKDNVSEKTTNDVEVYINDPNFTPEVIGKASVASAGLCKWVHAIYKYTLVNRVVIPKRIMLAKASKELSELMGVLEGKRSIVRAVELKIQTLMDELNEANATKEQLEVSVLDCQEKLIRAEKLMRYNIVCLLFVKYIVCLDLYSSFLQTIEYFSLNFFSNFFFFFQITKHLQK